MTQGRKRKAVLLGVLMVVLTACNQAALDDAEAEIEDLKSEVASLEQSNSDLEAQQAALEGDVETLQSDKATLEADKAVLEETMASQGQALILQSDIVGEGCMLQNAYLNDGEAKATFRVRVYDPITGEQLDDQALESVKVTIDGQEFDLHWGAHPPDTDNDFFWTYGWEIFAGYPAGNIDYTIVATALDGRTGQFDMFNVAPSVLTVMDPTATES